MMFLILITLFQSSAHCKLVTSKPQFSFSDAAVGTEIGIIQNYAKASNSSVSFFDTFPKVVVQISELQIETINTLISQIRNHQNRSLIEIWLVISGNTRKDWLTEYNNLFDTELILPNLFTAVVYEIIVGVLQLSSTRNQIQQDYKLLSHKTGNNKLRMGVAIRDQNFMCMDLEKLPLDLINFAYLPAVTSESDLLVNLVECQKYLASLFNVTIELGIFDAGQLSLNPMNNEVFYKHDQEIEQFINNPQNTVFKTSIPLRYIMLELVDSHKQQPCDRNKDVENWLKYEPEAQSKFPGNVIQFDVDDISWRKNLLQKFLKKSSILMIENALALNDSILLPLGNFLNDLTSVLNQLRSSERRPNTADSMLTLVIQLNFFDDLPIEQFAIFALQAVLAGQKANLSQNSIVYSIVIKFNDENLENHIARFNWIYDAVKGSFFSNHLPKLGIAMDNSKPNCISLSSSIKAELVILNQEVNLLKSACWTGAEYQTYFYHMLLKCQGSQQGIKISRWKIFYNFKTFNCNINDSNVGSLYEYDLMVKSLTDVTRAMNIATFLSPSFRTSQHILRLPDNSRDENGSMSHCGLWSINKHPSFAKQFIIEDNKKIARKLNRTKDSNDKPKENAMFNYYNSNIFRKEWMLVLTSILLVVTTVGAALEAFQYRKRYLLRAEELDSFFNGLAITNSETTTGVDLALSLKYNRISYELDKLDYNIEENYCLGAGECGPVYLGTIQRNQQELKAAIKIVKKGSRIAEHKDLLALKSVMSEIKILSYVGYHQNVVRLLGANTDYIRSNRLLLFLEYCKNGCFQKYLKALKPRDDATEATKNANSQMDAKLLKFMTKWSNEILNGMVYLASKNIVHGALSTRNVLLDANNVAKITDFGLSARLSDYLHYAKAPHEPWRWLAPEVLRKSKFSEKSDVWAYGVTLWEIYTFASKPYSDQSWTMEFPTLLENGLRLPMPEICKNKTYSLMFKCWAVNKAERPTFTGLDELTRNLELLTQQTPEAIRQHRRQQ